MIHIPLIRKGKPYTSLDQAVLPNHRSGEPFASVSQANPGLIRRDLLSQEDNRDRLAMLPTNTLVEMCTRAASYFLNDSLPLGDQLQTPADYVAQVSATTGLPYVLVRRNMQKIHNMLAQMAEVLNGLTRNLAWEVLDRGWGEVSGHSLSFFPRAQTLGVVLPNNSPGVHSLWIPSIPLKIPLVLKPGSAEPWTPYRIVQALVKAGVPPESFNLYSADHAAAVEILRGCGRGMIFGDAASTGEWQNDPRIEIHGPGYSKIVIGEDCIDNWESYLDVIVASIVENGGRSCINASGVWVPAHAREISESLAERLARIIPRDAEDQDAQLAPFTSSAVAARINSLIDSDLQQAGAVEVTASHRSGARLVEWQGCSYLRPTLIRCSPEHPLANREFLFPFASVVEVSSEQLPRVLGSSLVVTAITADHKLIRRLVVASNIDRLNIGPVATNQVSWDQPHEGNLFDHLYARRAFQRAVGV